jgi:hypothetical protein
MAEKKKIKNIKDNAGGSNGASITVNDLSATKPATSGTSTTAGAVAPDETFEQFGYKALCFNIGDIINTESIMLPGSATPTIVSARRIQRGTVLSIIDSTTGTIEENKSKKVISFTQPHFKEIGIAVGTEVKYDLIMTAAGTEMAVNVEIQP